MTLSLLAVSGCDTTAPDQPLTGSADRAAERLDVPPPAPLPPPPKPQVRARPAAPSTTAAAKPAVPGKPSSNGDAAAEAASAPPAPSGAADPPPTKEESETAQTMTTAALSPPPIRLVGLDRNAVTAMLGVPIAERQVAAARVWDYRAAECRLAVFFYLDTGRNDFYALHYEIDGTAPGSLPSDQCLQRIRDNARPR